MFKKSRKQNYIGKIGVYFSFSISILNKMKIEEKNRKARHSCTLKWLKFTDELKCIDSCKSIILNVTHIMQNVKSLLFERINRTTCFLFFV